MKKGIAFIFALFFTLYSGVGVLADCKKYSFYCKRNSEHKTPTLDKELLFIEELDSYYVDKKAAKANERVIYLTFDAGYENGNVERIVNVLAEHNAKGAFFILENLIKRAPELVKRLASEGHLVCNHTAKHKDMSKISSPESFAKELTDLEESYRALTGLDMARIYRPPEGRFSSENLKLASSLGYKTVFWSFAYADWDNNAQPTAEKALEKIFANLHNGEIMLLHPTSSTNAEILDKLLSELERRGYRFGCLTELWEEQR